MVCIYACACVCSMSLCLCMYFCLQPVSISMYVLVFTACLYAFDCTCNLSLYLCMYCIDICIYAYIYAFQPVSISVTVLAFVAYLYVCISTCICFLPLCMCLCLYPVSMNHRDNTRVQMPAKIFPQLKVKFSCLWAPLLVLTQSKETVF